MGCASSTEAAVQAAESSTPSKPNENASNKNYPHRVKTQTGGTEAMAVSAADDDDEEIDPAVGKNTTTTTHDPPTLTEKTGKIVLGTTNTIIRYACHSRKGKDPEDKTKPNQDCFGVHEQLFAAASFLGVYDGHGPDGAPCSHFVQQRLPALIQQNLKMVLGSKKSNTLLTTDQVQFALHQAHTDCNDELRACAHINDTYSGTTAISVYVDPEGRMTVSNVGDSRAIMGVQLAPQNQQLIPVPLSKDQTPYRKEEADRCRHHGARILSLGQVDPSTIEEGDEDVEDQPRVWSPKGNFPGTAFTRSLGDSVAQTLGVFAEPEPLTVKLAENVQVVVLASDGIFDVLSNQQVVDLCWRHRHHPVQACQALVDASHQAWLIQEECQDDNDANASYDDMTAICLFFGDEKADNDAATTSNTDMNNGEANTEKETQQQDQEQPENQREQRRRRRQKTLHNLEEWAEN